MFPRYASLVSPVGGCPAVVASLARHQANAVQFATKVCFSLFDGSEVLVLAIRRGNRATCGASETCDLLSVQIYIHR